MSAERKPVDIDALRGVGAGLIKSRFLGTGKLVQAATAELTSLRAELSERRPKDALIAGLVEAVSEVESTERDYWNMPPCRNPERYAERHDEAKKRLYAALAALRGKDGA